MMQFTVCEVCGVGWLNERAMRITGHSLFETDLAKVITCPNVPEGFLLTLTDRAPLVLDTRS